MDLILKILDLDALVSALTSPVLSCCKVGYPSVALTLAGGGQGEKGSFLAHNVTIFLKFFIPSLLTVTCIATPYSIVKIVKFIYSLSIIYYHMVCMITIQGKRLVTNFYIDRTSP